MPTLQIRNLDERVYRVLAESASRERRSLSRQASAILEQALLGAGNARDRRRRLIDEIGTGTSTWPDGLPPPQDLIRKDRQR